MEREPRRERFCARRRRRAVSGTLTVSGTAAAFPASSPATEHGSSCSNAPPPSVRLGRSTSASASAAVRMVTPPRVGIATRSRAVRLPTTTLRGAPKGVERRSAAAESASESGNGSGARGERPGCDTRCFVVSPARRRRRGGRRGRRVRERVPAPRRRARRSGPARVHQRSAHPLCRSAALLPPLEVREVRVVVHLVVVHHRRRQNGLPVRPEPPRTAHADAAGETPRERSPRRRSRRRRPRDGLGRGGEHTVLRETRLGVRRGLLRRFRVHGRRLPRRLRGFSGFSASLPRARRGGRRRRGVGRTRRRSGGGGGAPGGPAVSSLFFSLPSSPTSNSVSGTNPATSSRGSSRGMEGTSGARVRERRVRARRFAGFHLRLPPRRRERAPHQTRELRLRHALRLEDALDALVPASRAVPAERSFLGASLGRAPACRLAEPAFRRATPRHLGDAAYPEARGGARRSPRRARWRRARGETRGRAACAAEPRGPRAACHWTSGGHTRAQRQPARRTRRSRRR